MGATGKIVSKSNLSLTLTNLARLTNQLNAHLAKRDAAVLAAQATCSEEIAQTAAEIQVLELRVKEWAEANRAEEFADRQSLEMPRGTVGFRKGQRSLETLPKRTWKTVLAALKGRWKMYRRLKPEVDKRALLADSMPDANGKTKLTAAQLKELGLVVVQEEAFFVELRTELPALSANK